MEKIGNGPIVGGTAREYLDERRYTDYYDYKERLLQWLHTMGKPPERAKGYASSTVANVSYKVVIVFISRPHSRISLRTLPA